MSEYIPARKVPAYGTVFDSVLEHTVISNILAGKCLFDEIMQGVPLVVYHPNDFVPVDFKLSYNDNRIVYVEAKPRYRADELRHMVSFALSKGYTFYAMDILDRELDTYIIVHDWKIKLDELKLFEVRKRNAR